MTRLASLLLAAKLHSTVFARDAVIAESTSSSTYIAGARLDAPHHVLSGVENLIGCAAKFGDSLETLVKCKYVLITKLKI